MALYFILVVLSAFQAWIPKESLFYPWQLARMFLVYVTVVRGSSDPRVTPAIMNGLAAAIIMEAGFVVWQRYGLGIIQSTGTEEHQNLLGVMSHFVILPFFSLLVAGYHKRLSLTVVLAGMFIAISTASRGTIGAETFGLTTILVLSVIGKWASWKGRVLLMSTLLLLLLVPTVISTFQERFAEVPLGNGKYDDRTAYIKAAELMLSDHPFGIGANHFAVIGNVERYYERAGVQPYALALAGNVHNFYYLTAAETGYMGLAALLLFLARPLIVAFRCGWRNLGDYRGNLLLGLGVALLTVYLHSWVEWSFATFSAEYLLAIAMGLVAGNAQQLGYWSVKRLGAVRPMSSPFAPGVSSGKSNATDAKILR